MPKYVIDYPRGWNSAKASEDSEAGRVLYSRSDEDEPPDGSNNGPLLLSGALYGIGSLTRAIQVATGAEAPALRLTAEEIALGEKVFAGSVNLASVRVKHGSAGVFSGTGRSFTLGNCIYIHPAREGDRQTLVHELVHVWQFQHTGVTYIAHALWSQWTLHDAYDVSSAVRSGLRWEQMNPEQQAHLIDLAYQYGLFDDSTARVREPTSDDNPELVDITQAVLAGIKALRAGRGAPR